MSDTAPNDNRWFGHPSGLSTLFFTEMWERFSYYGMRALLVLFMVDQIENGGMGLNDAKANAIYGLYTAFVYLACLPGGWIADRLIGAQRAVYTGGIIIAAGHFTLAIPGKTTFFLGLILVVIGTGFLKPNVSAIVGALYPAGDARRDAGFTIFYMGINLGAFLGPLICGYLGEEKNWHYGFGAAGVGMLAGVIQYHYSRKKLGNAGLAPEHGNDTPENIGRRWLCVWLVSAGAAIIVILGLAGVIKFNALTFAANTTYIIVGIAVAFFTWVFAAGRLTLDEKKRTGLIVVLFFASAMFWSGFEQAGSSLNLFAERHTDRVLENISSNEIPASWFQSLNPFFIITLGPVFALLWVRLAKKMLEPTIPVKLAIGLILLAAGFLVMVGAAKSVLAGNKPAAGWLIMTYLLHTMGELCLSPVGLSAVTKLSPQRFAGQMMGIWFLATSLGNLIAGLFAGRFDPKNVDHMPDLFMQIVLTAGGTGLVLLVLSKPLSKLRGDSH